MNKQRRRQIEAVFPILATAASAIADATAMVKDVKAEEEEAYDNLSEGAQAGDQGDQMQSAIQALGEAEDALGMVDLRKVQQAIEEASDRAGGEELPEPATSQDEVDRRRWELLPQWAKDRIERLETDLRQTREKMAGMFAEPTGDPFEMVVGDYSGPTAGKVLPCTRVSIPSAGITISVEKVRKGGEVVPGGVKIDAEGQISVMPCVSNSIFVTSDRLFR